MTIDLDEGAERDDLALLTPTKRLHTIAQILADGIRRQREDAHQTPLGIPAANMDRPAIQRLMADIEAGECRRPRGSAGAFGLTVRAAS